MVCAGLRYHYCRVKHSYLELRERKRYSDVSLLAGILAVPVTLGTGCRCLCLAYMSSAGCPCTDPLTLGPFIAGLMCICMLDAYYTRRVHAHQL